MGDVKKEIINDADEFRWQIGVSNLRASAKAGMSMYTADEVVRLMRLYASQFVDLPPQDVKTNNNG